MLANNKPDAPKQSPDATEGVELKDLAITEGHDAKWHTTESLHPNPRPLMEDYFPIPKAADDTLTLQQALQFTPQRKYTSPQVPANSITPAKEPPVTRAMNENPPRQSSWLGKIFGNPDTATQPSKPPLSDEARDRQAEVLIETLNNSGIMPVSGTAQASRFAAAHMRLREPPSWKSGKY